jgi:hypothetical protein
MRTFAYTQKDIRIEATMMNHLNASEPADCISCGIPGVGPLLFCPDCAAGNEAAMAGQEEESPLEEGPSPLGGDEEGDSPDALTRAIEQTCMELERDNILMAAAADLITKEQALDAILRLRAKNAAWFAKRMVV